MQLQTQKRNFVESVKQDSDKDEEMIIITTKNKVYVDSIDQQPFYNRKSYKNVIKMAIVVVCLVSLLVSFILWLDCRRNSQIIDKTAALIQTPTTIISQEKLNNKKNQERNVDDKVIIDATQKESTQNKNALIQSKIDKKNIQDRALKQFNPWETSKEMKESLLEKYKKMPKKDPAKSQTMPIVQNRDQEILPFLREFEKTSQVVKYSSISMSPKQRHDYQIWFNKKVEQRLKKVQFQIKQQAINKKNPDEQYSKDFYKITRKQWFASFEYHSLVGVNIAKDQNARRIALDQVKYFQSTYDTGKYTNQLRICLISPGLNNENRQRYLWNVESVLQQNYTNYRMVIIDDLSTDKTIELLSKHLKWRGISQNKVTLVKNNKNQKATANVFYATHKYCGLGQIQIVLDSDDQLIGCQVFKALNAIYQKEKPLSLYSNYIFARGNPQNPLHFLGGSRDYLQTDIDNNNFRRPKIRGYSHLRTMLSDNFLLMKPQTLKDWRGQFYWIISDNAVYYTTMEMSCGRVRYLPELFVYYNFNTGLNDFQHVKNKQKKQDHDRISTHINEQKSYRCLAVQLMEISQYKL